MNIIGKYLYLTILFCLLTISLNSPSTVSSQSENTEAFVFTSSDRIILIDTSNIEYSFTLFIETYEITGGKLIVKTSDYSGITTNYGYNENIQFDPNDTRNIKQDGVHYLAIIFTSSGNSSFAEGEYFFQKGNIESLAISPYYVIIFAISLILVTTIGVIIKKIRSKND